MPGRLVIEEYDRRAPDRPADHADGAKRRRGSEPVTLRVFVGVLTFITGAFIVWLVTTGAGAVVSSRRFEADSGRRDLRDSMLSRDIREIKATGIRTDSGVNRLCLMLSSSPARDCR